MHTHTHTWHRIIHACQSSFTNDECLLNGMMAIHIFSALAAIAASSIVVDAVVVVVLFGEAFYCVTRIREARV